MVRTKVRIRRFFRGRACFILLAVCLAGCTVERIHNKAAERAQSGDYESAIRVLKEGVATNPESGLLQSQLIQTRLTAIERLLAQAAAARARGDFDEADGALTRAGEIDPGSERVATLRRDIQIEQKQRDAQQRAEELDASHQYAAALSVIEEALRLNTRNYALNALRDKVELDRREATGSYSQLGLIDTKPISLDFRDANLRSVLDVLARASGINFVLDKDIRPDTRITIYLRSTRFEDALDLITSTHQLDKKVLDEKTVMVYPNTPEKQREYQEQVVRVFYLSSGDAKGAAAFLKSMLKIRDPYIDEHRNLLSLRDTPENIQLASRLVAVYDQPDPEVLLEAEVIEVSKTRLTEMGITYPNRVTLSALVPNGGSQLTLKNLGGMTSNSIGVSIPDVLISMNRQVGDVNILASPKIRVRNNEKGKIMIGDKVPIITTTTNGTGLTFQSVNYQDVGLHLNVEPTIYADDDVAIKVELEVSTLGQQVTTTSGASAYQISTRNASTLLRLRDGETQLLGGLINTQESSSASRIPGLGDMPMIGRLFGNQSDTADRTELVLAITPHILRNVRRLGADNGELWVGTETNQRMRAPGGRVPPVDPVADAPVDRGGASPATSAPAAASGGAMPSQTLGVAPVLSWRAPSTVKVGDEFQVTLNIANKQALRGIPLRVVIPKAQVELVDTREGEYFRLGQSKTSFSSQYDKETGVLSVGVLRNLASGVTGEGDVLSLKLKALAAGSAELSMAGAEPIGSDMPVAPITTAIPLKLDIQP